MFTKHVVIGRASSSVNDVEKNYMQKNLDKQLNNMIIKSAKIEFSAWKKSYNSSLGNKTKTVQLLRKSQQSFRFN